MSPYENRVRSDKVFRFGLISFLRKPDDKDSCAPLESPDSKTVEQWAGQGLQNVCLFHDADQANGPVFLYVEYVRHDVDAVMQLLQCDDWFKALSPRLSPHPRAAEGSDWLPMELINLIGPTLPVPNRADPLRREGLTVRLNPASELTYRTLHQTNWPGVVDQMRRSNRRYWVTFLIELGEDLHLFTYSEYVGNDVAADDALMAADPVTQRWWKHTEPCLKPIHSGYSTWSPMSALGVAPPANAPSP